MRTRSGGLRQGSCSDVVRPEHNQKKNLRLWLLFRGELFGPEALQSKWSANGRRLNAPIPNIRQEAKTLKAAGDIDGLAAIQAAATGLSAHCRRMHAENQTQTWSTEEIAAGLCVPHDDYCRWIADGPNANTFAHYEGACRLLERLELLEAMAFNFSAQLESQKMAKCAVTVCGIEMVCQHHSSVSYMQLTKDQQRYFP